MPILQAMKGFFKGFRGGYSSGAASRRAKEELEKTIAKSAIPRVSPRKNDEFSGTAWDAVSLWVVYLFLLLLLAGGGYALWHAADEHGYIPHSKVTIVTAKSWTVGEYKDCVSPNAAEQKDEPRVDCSSPLDPGDQKRFEVRFYGRTYREDLKDLIFTWRCQKNDGTNPAFTCDEQKIIKRVETN